MSRRGEAVRLAEYASEVLLLEDPADGWPAVGSVLVSGTQIPVSLWIGPVGKSHRGRDDVERRFQNPGANRPIEIDPGRVPLLLGLWMPERNVATQSPIVVAADAARRAQKGTRFSVFVGLDSLMKAGTRGWSEAKNSESESIYSFRPSMLPRLVAIVTTPSIVMAHLTPDPAAAAGSSDRVSQIAVLAAAGLSLQEIGTEVGVSRERVRQILRDKWPNLAKSRKELSSALRRERSAEVDSAAADAWRSRVTDEVAAEGIDPDDVLLDLMETRHVGRTARKFGLDPARVASLYDASPFEFALVRRVRASAPRHSDEMIIEYLRQAREALGGSTLSAGAYNAFAGRQNLTTNPWPSAQTIANRFGGWRAACEAAGLEPQGGRATYTREFPAARCRAFVDLYVADKLRTGARPTYAGYEEWARTSGGPSGATVRNRLGGWSEALAASLRRVTGLG